FSSRRRHTRFSRDWSSDVCSSDLVPAPGHSDGMQMVVVETGGRPIIIGGDVAVWFGEFDEPPTEGRKRILALDPELVWLTHEHEPWRPAPPTGPIESTSIE